MNNRDEKNIPGVNPNRSPIADTRLRTSKIDQSPGQKAIEKVLFAPSNLEGTVHSYDIIAPGEGTSDTFLKQTNPPLYAFRNHAKKAGRPVIKSPIIPPKSSQITNTSRLSTKPLGDLPNITALQISKREEEVERQTLAFEDDPIAYFSKRKDGSGHHFIYLIYSMDRKDPNFSPYDLKKVPSTEIGNDYYTMSASGVTHIFANGETETLTIDQYSREKFIYEAIRKLKFFARYFIWKNFRAWTLFLKEQRFKGLLARAMDNTIFRNPLFLGQQLKIYDSQNTLISLLKQYLLCFTVGKKFRLEDFEEQSKENTEKLKSSYMEFINNNTEIIAQLFDKIADPLHVQVTDADFNFNRRHPNIQILENLEEQKAHLRYQKTEDVNRQIASLGQFIRTIDYMILETLAKICVDCWKQADHNVSQEGSSIFQVEVLFTDQGTVDFTPNLEQLEKSITGQLANSIDTLNKLPRILKMEKLRVLIENSGSDFKELCAYGPALTNFTSCENILPEIEERIIKTLRQCYNEAFITAQDFSSLYPIYKMGKCWDVKDYLITRKGTKFVGEIQDPLNNIGDDTFLVKSDEQPVVDFEKVKEEMQQLLEDDHEVNNLRQGIVKGVLHIDLKGLRQILKPIPKKTFLDLQNLLDKLSSMKIQQVDGALTNYGKILKMEPSTLDGFVSFCETFKRAEKVKPAIENEIKFVDETYNLFEKFQLQHKRNPLHQKYQVFQSDFIVAQSIKSNVINYFIKQLKEMISNLESKLNKNYEKVSAIPPTLTLVDIEKELPRSEKRLRKMRELETQVTQAIRYQEIIDVEINKFAFYNNVININEFALTLYTSIENWQKISEQIAKKPFSNIDIVSFKDSVMEIDSHIKKLQLLPASNNYPILVELAGKVNEISPYIDELEKLSSSRMQPRHWNNLFESCNQQASYNPKMTTDELIKMNILQHKDKIEQITNMSLGEYKLETEFFQITNYWNKVQMPIAETQGTLNEENLLLGNTDQLLQEINDALININSMLQRPYVQGIRDTVTNLASTLENINQIIEAWQLFQSNWIILSAIFSQELTRSLLPQQMNKFSGVQRKWSTIARHTIKDTRLFSVCSFPSLLDALNENNQTMESIIASLGKLLDTKRNAMPRLFFLSNDDVLKLISSTSVKEISITISKILMFVNSLECKNEVGEDGPIFQSKVYKIIGDDGYALSLSKPVDITPVPEQWIGDLIEKIHENIKDLAIKAILKYSDVLFSKWITMYEPNILAIALYVVLTTSLKNFLLKQTMKGDISFPDLIKDYISQVSTLVRGRPELAGILSILMSFRDRHTNLIAQEQKRKGLNPVLDFETMLNFRKEDNQIVASISKTSWELGYEFWGKVPFLVHTNAIEFAYQSLARGNREIDPMILLGSTMTGKASTIYKLSFDMGRFIYSWYPFPHNSEHFLSRILIGTCLTGSWCIFNHIEQMENRYLCYLFDNIHTMYQLLKANSNKIIISSKTVELDPNARFYFTGHHVKYQSECVPPQIRSTIRSIALSDTNPAQIIEIRLLAKSFIDTKRLSLIINSLITTVPQIIAACKSMNSLLYSAFMIIDGAVLLRTKGVDDVSGLMYSAYQFFSMTRIDNEKQKLINVISSCFNVSVDEINQRFEKISFEENREKYLEIFKEEITKINPYLPVDYLANRTLDLMFTLTFSDSVIIIGQPSSGKSLIVKILKQSVSSQKFHDLFPNASQYEIFDCYYNSENPNRLYGHIYDDLTFGQTWAYGHLQAILNQMHNKSKTINILRFDGSYSKEFMLFMRYFVPQTNCNAFRTASQDFVYANKKMKVIYESTSCVELTPGLLSRIPVIYMKSCQINTSLIVSCELNHPHIILKRAFIDLGYEETEHASLFAETFVDLIPKVVKFVYHSKNKVRYSQKPEKMKDGEIYLSEVLPYFTAIVALNLIFTMKLDMKNQYQMSLSLVYACNRIFSQFLEDSEKEKFDQWLREEEEITVPKDWIGYNVPDLFWNMYPKPCLSSMQVFEGKLIPLNFKLTDNDPIYQARSEGQLPIFPNEVHVMNVQFLHPLEITNRLLESQRSIIIHGPKSSGRDTFLRILFAMNDVFLPITFDASDFVTADEFISFFLSHTPFLSKILTPGTQNKIIILVIRGLKPHHTRLQEFLRQINNTGKINAFSTTDPKVYETLTIMRFVTIITVEDLTQYDIRFVQKYIPIGLSEISNDSAIFMASKILQAYGHKPNNAEFYARIATNLLGQFDLENKPLLLLQSLFTICHLSDDIPTHDVVKQLFAEMRFRFLHQFPYQDVKDKIEFIGNNECRTENEKKAAWDLVNSKYILLPICHLTKDMKQFSIDQKTVQYQQLADMIIRDIAIFNANVIEKLSLRVTPALVDSWAMLLRALRTPGCNIIINGIPGLGKYSITRIIAHSCEYDFINIAPPTIEEQMVKEDRMFSLSSVIRDVVINAALHQKRSVIFTRATKESQQELDSLILFVTGYDYTHFFTKSTLEDLYTRFTNSHALTFEQKIIAMRQIKNILRINIHVVIAQNEQIIKGEHAHFVEINLNHDTTNYYTAFAQEAIEQPATKKVIGSSTTTVSQVLGNMHTVARKFTSYFHPNMMYDFIDSFCHFTAADFQNLNTKFENSQSAISFIDKLQGESHVIERRLDSLAPTLQRLQVDSESLNSSYTQRKEAIDNRQQKLIEDKKTKLAEVETLRDDVERYDAEFSDLSPKLTQAIEEVKKLTKNEIDTIRISANDPMPSMRLLFELFCLFLDMAPSYERSGQKLLMDPNFIELLTGCITTDSITPKVLELAMPYFENEAMNPTELEATAPALFTLFNWIHLLCQYCQLSNSRTTQRRILEEKERSLQQYMEEMDVELASIEQVAASLENELKNLQASQASREQMEKDYKAISERKKSLESIFKDIEQFVEKWQNDTREFPQKKDKLIGNSMLFSFFLVFGGVINIENRVTAYLSALELIKNAGIECDDGDVDKMVQWRFIQIRPEFYYDRPDTAHTLDIATDIHHIFATLRTPLLIDPDGMAYSIVAKDIKSRLIECSANSSTLDVTAAQAVSEGRTLLIYDVMQMIPLLSILIPLDSLPQENSMQKDVRIGSRVVAWDPNFKLILVSPAYSIKELPLDLLSRCTTIDVTATMTNNLKHIFKQVFGMYFHETLFNKLLEDRKNEIMKRVNEVNYERNILDILADIVATQGVNSGYDYLSDTETIEELLKSKEEYFKNKSLNVESTSQEEYKNIMHQFSPLIHQCATFWEIASRVIPKISHLQPCSLLSYMRRITQIFASEGYHAGQLLPEQLISLRVSITDASLQMFFSNMAMNDALFFLFLSSFIMRIPQTHLTLKDIKPVIDHIRQTYNSKLSYKDTNQDMDPFEKLRYTSFENIFETVRLYVSELYGEEILQNFPEFTVDRIISNNPQVPNIIISSQNNDPSDVVHHLVAQRSKVENVECISICDDLEFLKNIRKVMSMATSRGNWILLHITENIPATISILSDIFTQMTTTSINTNYRMIILSSNINSIPPSLHTKGKRTIVNLIPTVKSVMQQIITFHAPQLVIGRQLKLMKKLVYAVASLLAFVSYRNVIRPNGFNVNFSTPLSTIQAIGRRCSEIFGEDEYTQPIENIRNVIMDCAFQAVCDPRDRQMINHLLTRIIRMETFQDGFKVGVGPESELWIMPDDEVPLPSFSQYLQKIPAYPMVETLGVDPLNTPLKDWTLSRYIAQPFLKYVGPVEVPHSGILVRIEDLLAIFPTKLTNDPSRPSSPIHSFIEREIVMLNNALEIIGNSLREMHELAEKYIYNKEVQEMLSGKVPTLWQQAAKVYTFYDAHNFINFMLSRQKMLKSWTEEFKYVINTPLVTDPKSLIIAFAAEEAQRQKLPLSELEYDFTIVDTTVDTVKEGELLLTKLSQEFCVISSKTQKIVRIDKSQSSPFIPLPSLLIKMVKVGTNVRNPEKTYVPIGLFKEARPSEEDVSEDDRNIYQGRPVNFITNIYIETEDNPSYFSVNGSSIFCRTSEYFM